MLTFQLTTYVRMWIIDSDDLVRIIQLLYQSLRDVGRIVMMRDIRTWQRLLRFEECAFKKWMRPWPTRWPISKFPNMQCKHALGERWLVDIWRQIVITNQLWIKIAPAGGQCMFGNQTYSPKGNRWKWWVRERDINTQCQHVDRKIHGSLTGLTTDKQHMKATNNIPAQNKREISVMEIM